MHRQVFFSQSTSVGRADESAHLSPTLPTRTTGRHLTEIVERGEEPCWRVARKHSQARVLPFDTDAARHYADLAVTAKDGGRSFPTPDGYIVAVAASRGFIVASRDTSPYAAAGVSVINPWQDL